MQFKWETEQTPIFVPLDNHRNQRGLKISSGNSRP